MGETPLEIQIADHQSHVQPHADTTHADILVPRKSHHVCRDSVNFKQFEADGQMEKLK
jgi:hypothetical protein